MKINWSEASALDRVILTITGGSTLTVGTTNIMYE